MRSLASLDMLDALGAFLEDASLEDEYESLSATFTSQFGGTPLLGEPVSERERWYTRVRSFI